MTGAPRPVSNRLLIVHHAVDHHGVRWLRGSTRLLLDLLTHLDRSRFEPIVWTNAAVLPEVAATGVTVHESPDWAVTGRRLSPRWIRDVCALIRRYDVRLIHADEYRQAAVLVPAARLMRRPLLAQIHRVPDEGERRWSLLHQVDLAVGSSRACITGLLDDGFPSQRATVIYDAIDVARLGHGTARTLRQELGIGHDDVVITMVAYFQKWKSIDVALSAFHRLGQRRGGCHLLLCGDGPERRVLESQAAALGIRERTHFLGDRRDVGAILRDATDILLSTSASESFNLTLAEGGAFGVPAVTTNIDAHREVCGGAGLLVEPGDVDGFAGALATLADDVDGRRRLGEQLRRRVESTFLIDRYVREFQNTYAQMMAEPSGYGWRRGITWPRTYSSWLRQRVPRLLSS
jgi:glycosyltransferase involved in cell wall biosynthesis